MQDSDRDRLPRDRIFELPAFELVAAVDDEAEPTTVTVFPAGRADVTPTWLTIDLDHVVDHQDMV